MDYTDALIEIAGGSRPAFAALYGEMQRHMVRYATGLLAGDCEGAEDAVDEAFMDIWRSAGSWSGIGSAEAWIRRIVRNKAVDWLRKRKGEISASHQIDMILAQTADSDASHVEQLEHLSEASSLQAALRELDVKHREVVWLCYFEEKSLAEIALIADCPLNTVKTRLFHARKKLKLLLEPVV